MTSGNPKNTPVVLHIFSGDLWAGAEVMVFHLLNQLNKRQNIELIAFSLNKGTLSEKLRDAGIETHIFPENKNSFLKIFFKVLRAAYGRNISIIHSHRYKENVLAFLLGKCIGIKHTITTLHGLPEALSSSEESSETAKKTKPDMATNVNYFIIKHFFSCVVAVSQDIKKVLIEKYNFRSNCIALVYNGIEIPDLLPSPVKKDSNTFLVGTVGRMVPVKDFELFLKVAAELRKHFKNIRFSILGDGPLKDYLTKYKETLGLGSCVKFLRPVADPFPFYKSLDIYLNTSIHEGIPLSILEAMASGLPVVAPSVGGIPEIIDHGKNAMLFKDRNPAGIAKACLQLLDGKNAENKMGIKAREKVQNCFSNTYMADNYYRQYILLQAK